MTTAGLGHIRMSRLRERLTGMGTGLVLMVISASVTLAAVRVADESSVFAAVAAVATAALALWCATTRHPVAAVGVVMAFVLLADGFIKLRINSSAASLLRDLLFAATLINLVSRRRIALRSLPPWLTIWVAAFIGVVLVQTLNPGTTSTLQAVAGLRLHLEFVPLFAIGALCLTSQRHLDATLRLLVVAGALNSLTNIIQFNLSPEQFASWGPGYQAKILGEGEFSTSARVGFTGAEGAHTVRPFGLGPDLGFGGTVAALAIPAAIVLAMTAQSRQSRWLWSAAALLNVVGVGLGGARVAVVCAVVGAAVFIALGIMSRQGPKLVLTISALTVVAVFVAPKLFGGGDAHISRIDTLAPSRLASTTSTARGGSIKLIPDYLTRYPLGAGIGQSGNAAQFTQERQELDAETEFTFLTVELGIPGVIVMLVIQASTLIGAVTVSRREIDPVRRLTVLALLTPIAGVLVLWIVAPVSAGPPFATYVWLAAGIAAVEIARLRGRSPPLPT